MEYVIGAFLIGLVALLAHNVYDQQLRRTCPCHGHPLELGTAVVVKGMVLEDPEYDRVARTRFPWAKSREYTGCLVDDEDPDHTSVRYCPRCREAEADWERQNRLRY